MKIYRKIVMDYDGNVLYEDSFEYCGPVAFCKKGRLKAAREQKTSADTSFGLQKKMFEWQKRQAKKLEEGRLSEEAQEAMRKERILALKRAGHRSTIKTIKTRPDYETFKAQFMEKYPLELLKEKSTQKLEREAMSSADPGFFGVLKKLFEIKKGTGLEDKKTKSKNEMLEARYDRLIRQSFAQEKPMQRLTTSPAVIKKRKLIKNA